MDEKEIDFSKGQVCWDRCGIEIFISCYTTM